MKIWIIGAYGIVSTTAMVGAKAIEKNLTSKVGLISALPPFKKIDEYVPFSFEFGGHEIRPLTNAYEAAYEHWEMNRHFEKELLEAVKEDLSQIVAAKGTALNCGSGIEGLGEIKTLEDEGLTLREIVDRILEDMRKFADDETVVINVA
ncbi:myo-inositol-1-phosphate synthase, partial [Archaeoglobales archaeon]